MTREARVAIELVARTEGILLDPSYTGKAMAGLIDHVRRGAVRPGSTVIFIHTGECRSLRLCQRPKVVSPNVKCQMSKRDPLSLGG